MCPGLEQLERLAARELPEPEQRALQQHLAICDPCSISMREIQVNLAVAARLAAQAAAVADAAPTRTPRAYPDPDDGPALANVIFDGYENIRELSRGGQGVVYRATQAATKQRVAIKVLLHGPQASAAHRRRFEREIELAAQLRHPNIVSVLHSSTMPDGRAFLVMDYVRGSSLEEYVRERKLPMRSVLELFAQVCDAVQYAHQRGIIHRDLKPSNILVDAAGNPRVLDFGLAKRLSACADTYDTMTMQILGTLAYMSPEQARGNPDEVDTRSDVYSLGVILYQILTGQFPYPVGGSMPEIIEHIVRTPPTSATRSWSAQIGVSVAEGQVASGTCPIDDEVETIVMKCLAKERERRYQSAGELARDLQHYLAGEAIDAKRDSGFYLLRKALRRHRIAVAATAAFVALVTCSSVVTTALWRRAEQDRLTAERTSEFLSRILTFGNPGDTKTASTPFQGVLDDAAAAMARGELREIPPVLIRIRLTLAEAYQTLGLLTDAEIQAAAALEAAQQMPRQPNTYVADALYRRGTIFFDRDDHRRAEADFTLALGYRKRLFGEASGPVAEVLSDLGLVYWRTARFEESERAHTEALAVFRRLKPSGAMSDALANQGLLAESTGRLAEAQSLFSEASRVAENALGDTHLLTCSHRINLARNLQMSGNLDAAAPILEDVQRTLESHFTPEHPFVAWVLFETGHLHLAKSDLDAASESFTRAIEIARKSSGPQSPDVALYTRGLALASIERSDLAGAETLLRESLGTYETLWPDRVEVIANARSVLGDCLRRQRRFSDAESLLLPAFNVLREFGGRYYFTREVAAAERIVDLYTDWNTAEPSTDLAQKCREWTRKRDNLRNSTTHVRLPYAAHEGVGATLQEPEARRNVPIR